MVDGGGNVEPCEPTVDVVVSSVVGGPVVGVVTGLLVVVVEPMHGPSNETEVEPVFVNPSVHLAWMVSVTLPVALAGTTVLADVACVALPLGPTVA